MPFFLLFAAVAVFALATKRSSAATPTPYPTPYPTGASPKALPPAKPAPAPTGMGAPVSGGGTTTPVSGPPAYGSYDPTKTWADQVSHQVGTEEYGLPSAPPNTDVENITDPSLHSLVVEGLSSNNPDLIYAASTAAYKAGYTAAGDKLLSRWIRVQTLTGDSTP